MGRGGRKKERDKTIRRNNADMKNDWRHAVEDETKRKREDREKEKVYLRPADQDEIHSPHLPPHSPPPRPGQQPQPSRDLHPHRRYLSNERYILYI